MSKHRNALLGSGAVLVAVVLTTSGTIAGYASTSSAHDASKPVAAVPAAAPNPYAPHVGLVAGLQTGPHISANNAESVHAFKVLHHGIAAAQHGASSPRPPQYLHQWLGTSFDDTTSLIGTQADQHVNPNIFVNEHFTTLYTPTMYPTGGASGGVNGSCIEMSTMYHRNHNWVAAWDWCDAITFVAEVNINKAFMRTYTKNGFYTDQIVQTDRSTNTWTSYLYNYRTGEWNQFFQQSGTARIGTGDGWDFYEIYSAWRQDGTAFSCKDLHGYTVSAKNIMEDLDGTWTLADPDNAGHRYDSPLSGFRCPEIKYKIITPYNHWKVWG